jgi:deoxyribodipyrimidine photo-lyase
MATPSDFINNMIELKQTGFMSNRGRQNVASYFCNELNMDGFELLILNH